MSKNIYIRDAHFTFNVKLKFRSYTRLNFECFYHDCGSPQDALKGVYLDDAPDDRQRRT